MLRTLVTERMDPVLFGYSYDYVGDLAEPVFETDSARPCNNATFSKSYCQQAYRWNLDYVVDTHADTIAYFYQTDQNYYSAALGSTAGAAYVRAGYLSKIQYGQRDGQVYSTLPAAQVTFTVNGRCGTDAGRAENRRVELVKQ